MLSLTSLMLIAGKTSDSPAAPRALLLNHFAFWPDVVDLVCVQGIQDIAYYLNPSPSLRRRRRADLRQLLRDVGEVQYNVDGGLRRHSVQVRS